MTIRPVAFTPYAAIRALVRRDAPSRRTRSSTAPCQSRTVRSMASRRSATSGPAARRWSAAGPCRPRSVRHEVAARSAARSAAASTSSATPDSSAAVSSVPGWGRPVIAAAEPVAQPPDPVLQRAQQLAGADELLPAGQDLAAQQRAVPHALVDVGDRALVGRVGVRPQPLRGVDLRPGLRGEPGGPRAGGCRARRRGCGGRPRRGARRRGRGRRTSRGAGRRPARAAGRRAASTSGTTNSGAPPRPCAASISCRCAATSSSAPGGTRSSSTASAVPRSCAVCRTSQGTASA